MQVTLSGADYGGKVVEWKGKDTMVIDNHIYRLHEDKKTAQFVGLMSNKPTPVQVEQEPIKKSFWKKFLD